MITEGVLNAVLSFVSWMLEPLPTWEVPDALAPGGSVDSTIRSTGSFASQLGHWLPWDAMFGAVALVALSITVMVGIKIARIVLSYVTLGGGNA